MHMLSEVANIGKGAGGTMLCSAIERNPVGRGLKMSMHVEPREHHVAALCVTKSIQLHGDLLWLMRWWACTLK
jgi:hypothetical protein